MTGFGWQVAGIQGTGCKLQGAGCGDQLPDCRFQIAGFRLPVTGLQVAGSCKVRVTGCWCRLLAWVSPPGLRNVTPLCHLYGPGNYLLQPKCFIAGSPRLKKNNMNVIMTILN